MSSIRYCNGSTMNGTKCKRLVKEGKEYCYQHDNSDGSQNSENAETEVDEETNGEKTLYERLGGIFNIAAVVDLFSEAILESPLVGVNSPNPNLRDWSRNHQEDRLPGLKWMRTLWVASITGGPYKYIPVRPGSTPLGLENAHREMRISPEEFDEVARILAMTLDHFKVPPKEKNEVLTAFIGHKAEVNKGYFEALKASV